MIIFKFLETVHVKNVKSSLYTVVDYILKCNFHEKYSSTMKHWERDFDFLFKESKMTLE